MAGNSGSITERSKVRGILPFPPDVFIKNPVYNPADGFINGSSVNKILVISSAISDIEAVTPVPVPRNHEWRRKGKGWEQRRCNKKAGGLGDFREKAGAYF